VYQSGANILFSVRSIMDSTQEVAQFTAESTGRIGNALKRAGVVFENSYKWMPEQVNGQNAFSRRFERITSGLENIEDAAGALQNVTGEILSAQEELSEIRENREGFEAALKDLPPKAIQNNKPVLDEFNQRKIISESPLVEDADLEADE